MGGDPPRRDPTANCHGHAPPVEEDEIEGEAHAEGVDAGAARDQQPRPCLLAVEVGEAEQAGAEAGGDGRLMTQNVGNREATQPPGEWAHT